jgi:hypothetical protein
MLRNELKDIITKEVTVSIEKYLRKKGKKQAYQILDLLIPNERKIRSKVGGLETSLGRTLWEPLAKTLAKENGFIVHARNLECPSNMPAPLFNTLKEIIEAREQNNEQYNALTSHDTIKKVCQQFIKYPIPDFKKAPKGSGVDIWLEKDGNNYLFDTKTVQPNLKAFTGFLAQILTWYAYFYSKNPTGHVIARIVFPYNPYLKSEFWIKSKGNGKPLEPGLEAWVGNEFWDFVSGHEKTLVLIEESFIEIHEKGHLDQKFRKLFE